MTEGLNDVRREMKELSSEARRHALILFERRQEQLEIIGTHVADISQRLAHRPPAGLTQADTSLTSIGEAAG